MSSNEYSAEQLRAAAFRHEEIARRYRELADLLERAEPSLSPGRDHLDSSSASLSKKTAVRQDLLINGPSTAKEIHQRTGIPLPTIYFVCQDSKMFRKKGLHWQAVKPRSSDALESHRSSAQPKLSQSAEELE